MSIDPTVRRIFTGTGIISPEIRKQYAPAPGTRCKRCHRTAPRADGIPCALCAPSDYSPEAAEERHRETAASVGRAMGDLFVGVMVRHVHRSDANDGWGQ